jgi:hypothetical protein
MSERGGQLCGSARVDRTRAADANDVAAALLAASGVLETGFQNVNEKDGAGVGVGVFKLPLVGRPG